ncbi:MAG: T9SS type A sorting domain-containing protein, partial [Candidatus Cloacimonetes bacterium]|nr:T9SS type A sorting domain-containing protein [Candidatus Cloacimonadota bacterium]
SDGDMFIYTESEYLNRVAFSYSTIQLDETNDNITLWADDDGVWDIDNSLPIDHISWGDPLIEPPDGIEWENYIDDGSENRSLSKAYFSSGDDTINDDAADWVTDGTATLGTLNSGQTYSGSGWQPDPSNHVSDFSAVATGFYSIEATWTENDGTVVPDGYLLKASTGSITAPSDGYSPPDDIDLTDGSGNVLVAHGNSSYTFTNCNALTTYNFKIYPYTNSGSLINFKTDGTVPVTDANTPSDVTVPSAGDLIISEIVGVDGSPLAGCGFIEILNVSGNTLDITNCMLRYYCDGEDVASISSFFWVAELGRNEYYIIANHNDFSSAYGFEPDQVDTALPLDGGTDGIDIIYSAMRSETIDQLNEVGAGVTPWSWNSDDVLERNTTSSGSSQTSWTDPGGTGTPGEDGDTPLPVTLSSFTGSVVNGFPTLNWTTESELENLGWNIYRSEDENGFEDNSLKLNNDLIPGMGTISIPTDYVFVDENLDETGTFYYWIQSVSFSCELELFGPVEIEIQNTIPIAPVNSFLTKNYPNPFNPATTIEFGVKEGEIGKLTIYNILGQKVLSRKYEEGFHTFIWDAATYSSGVYFYRLQTPTFHKTDKMIMLK